VRQYLGRGPALGFALALTLGRPLRLLAILAPAALLVAGAALAALLALRVVALPAASGVRPVVTVVMPAGSGAPEAAHVREVLTATEGVESLQFVPRDAALADLARRPALAGAAIAELQPNPLPDAWIATFSPTAGAARVESGIEHWRKDSWVASVEYDPAPWRKWDAGIRAGRALLLLLAGIAAAALAGALATCALAVPFPAREETRVLLDLGAEPGAIRRPFAYCGAIQLGLATLAGWGALAAAMQWLELPFAQLAAATGLELRLEPVSPLLALGAAAALGCLGWALAAIATAVRFKQVSSY